MYVGINMVQDITVVLLPKLLWTWSNFI